MWVLWACIKLYVRVLCKIPTKTSVLPRGSTVETISLGPCIMTNSGALCRMQGKRRCWRETDRRTDWRRHRLKPPPPFTRPTLAWGLKALKTIQPHQHCAVPRPAQCQTANVFPRKTSRRPIKRWFWFWVPHLWVLEPRELWVVTFKWAYYYRAMLHRARYCYTASRLSVFPWRWGIVVMLIGWKSWQIISQLVSLGVCP